MDIIAYSSQVGATKVALKTGYDRIKKIISILDFQSLSQLIFHHHHWGISISKIA